MHEGLLHGDYEGEVWRFAGDREACLQGSVSDNSTLAAHAQRVAMARYHEDQRDVRALDHVRKRIETVISRTVGNSQRLVIENGDEARWVAFG